MKKIFGFWILIVCLLFVSAKTEDIYKVIKVVGSIEVIKTGKELQRGDTFKENTLLKFNSPESKATVINSKKGRFVIARNSESKSKNNLIPAINNVASRNGAVLTIIDLKNLFEGKLFVLHERKIKIALKDYKVDKNCFFYIQYKFKGESVNKPLPSNKDSLIVNLEKLLIVDGKPIKAPDDTHASIWYLDKDRKGHLLSNFELIIANEKELKEEVNVLLTELEGETNSKKIDEVYSYINEFYGKFDKEEISNWLWKSFKLK